MQNKVNSNDSVPYGNNQDTIIEQAIAILKSRVQVRDVMSSPEQLKHYFILENSKLDSQAERFSIAFLDSQNRLIAYQVMFTGTLTQTSVYPREVVRAALAHGAASVVLTHNHPSGNVQPSRADEHLTQTLKSALALIDVRVLDHIIVNNFESFSFAETGLI